MPSSTIPVVTETLDEPAWRDRAERHLQRTMPWVAPRQQRRARGESHPIDDFLFDYYPYSVARLTVWHPGVGVEVTGDVTRFLEHPAYRRTEHGAVVDPEHVQTRRSRLDLAIRLLDRTSQREPEFGCFGMHEWAMVYGLEQEQIRHASHRLRLRPEEIVNVVDSVGLRCTHIDAYRFFTEPALEMNAHRPTRQNQPDLEQPGCIHAGMDLYKYAQWFHPLIPSELTADCFEVAREARALDMQASPYDAAPFGLEPIEVETPQGRRRYAEEQRLLAQRTGPLRERLLDVLRSLPPD